ncbi:MAG: hypothetical protein AB8H47_05520 [Bacteroidia bacterium]
MRNRKLNRGLIPIVILVWGLIGYRFWYEKEAPGPSNFTIDSQFLKAELTKNEADTFALSLPYRDPFLGDIKEQAKRSPKEQKAKLSSIEKVAVDLPHILYQGSIKAKERLGLVRWNGESHTVHANESLYDAKVKFISPQYIDLVIAGKAYRIARGKSIGAG